MKNKKIRNATPTEYDGIQFKSIIEKRFYKRLVDEGFSVLYEPTKFILFDSFRPKSAFFDGTGKNKRGPLKQQTSKIINITYTPDFLVDVYPYEVYIEVKSIENDVFPIKKKLFRKVLDEYNEKAAYNKAYYFEVRSILQLEQCMEYIKENLMNKEIMNKENDKNT